LPLDISACGLLVAQSALNKYAYAMVSPEGNGYNYLLFQITFVWFGRPEWPL